MAKTFTMQPTATKSSTSTKEQAKADFKAKSALVHQPAGQWIPAEPYEDVQRKTPEPIKVPELKITGISKAFVDIAVITLTVTNIAAWGFPPLNNTVRKAFDFSSKVARYTQETFGELGFTPEVGDTINGYKVTSGYGDRPAPCEGCSTNHPAIDIATPIGTPVYVPARHPNDLKKDKGETVLIQCRQPSETGGGGLVGEVLLPERGVVYQMLHLSKCDGWLKQGGNQFAATGNTGIGTGAHLDIRKARTTAQSFAELTRPLEYEPITFFEAHWILTGVAPKNKAPEDL